MLGVPGAWKKGGLDADAAACAISRERKSAVAKKSSLEVFFIEMVSM